TARRARLESGPPAPVHATAAVTTATDPSITGPGRHAATAEASQKPSKPNTNPGVTHRPNRCTRRSPAVNDVVDVATAENTSRPFQSGTKRQLRPFRSRRRLTACGPPPRFTTAVSPTAVSGRPSISPESRTSPPVTTLKVPG